MRWFRISIFAAVAATLIIAGAGAAELRVYANVDTSKDIYAGEQFNLQIIIDGYDQPGQVDLWVTKRRLISIDPPLKLVTEQPVPLPHTKVGRPRGRPPQVSPSRPWIPA